MTKLHYTVVTKKNPLDVVGLVEFVGKGLNSKPYQHYVFQVVTNHLADVNGLGVSGLNGWTGNIKTISGDNVEGKAERVVKFQVITVGKNVGSEKVFKELAYIISQAEKASKDEEFVCFSVEFLKSHIDAEDFLNNFPMYYNRENSRFKDYGCFWNEGAKTMTFFNY